LIAEGGGGAKKKEREFWILEEKIRNSGGKKEYGKSDIMEAQN